MGARPPGLTPGSQMAGPHPRLCPGPDGAGEDKGLSHSPSLRLAAGLASEARLSQDAGLAPGLLLGPLACGVRAPGRAGPPGTDGDAVCVAPRQQRPRPALTAGCVRQPPPRAPGLPRQLASGPPERARLPPAREGSWLAPPVGATVGAGPQASQGRAEGAHGSHARVSPRRLCDSRPGEQCSGSRTSVCPSEKHARPAAVWGGRRRAQQAPCWPRLPAGTQGYLSARRALCRVSREGVSLAAGEGEVAWVPCQGRGGAVGGEGGPPKDPRGRVFGVPGPAPRGRVGVSRDQLRTPPACGPRPSRLGVR